MSDQANKNVLHPSLGNPSGLASTLAVLPTESVAVAGVEVLAKSGTELHVVSMVGVELQVFGVEEVQDFPVGVWVGSEVIVDFAEGFCPYCGNSI